ncbi:MAG: hypothetical protein AAFN92_08635 [Bacteroidota bacterium]
MNTITISDPVQLKEALINILRENPDILKAAVQEILVPENPEEEESPKARRERLRTLIQKDFDRFEDVFKALA